MRESKIGNLHIERLTVGKLEIQSRQGSDIPE